MRYKLLCSLISILIVLLAILLRNEQRAYRWERQDGSSRSTMRARSELDEKLIKRLGDFDHKTRFAVKKCNRYEIDWLWNDQKEYLGHIKAYQNCLATMKKIKAKNLASLGSQPTCSCGGMEGEWSLKRLDQCDVKRAVLRAAMSDKNWNNKILEDELEYMDKIAELLRPLELLG
ncbi:uncharacterized protein KY384_008751 [Bacidia gigantensis]|uniref:uncharacterized protein n=1 Tax=Bacidia gigantensis TaxID=2732470 RepID=UPI001D03CFAC|nr:uncharacterized protein KY384_008751 [Bacidia gigantensis]KAG8526550.1 hypothetical protein KY384_008751 [Bacidia gigantensis]